MRKLDVKWILVCLIFFGLVTLLFSAMTIDANVIIHQRLCISSLVFWALAALLLIGLLIDNRLTRNGLNEREKNALMYFTNSGRNVISAENFSLIHGQDIYLSLLRKGLIENCFKKGRQEVYCRLSNKGFSLYNKLKS